MAGLFTRIPAEEYALRRQRCLTTMREHGLHALVLFRPVNVYYLSNFFFIPTERPMALVVTADDQRSLLVPELEREHAEENAYVDGVFSYPEYPGLNHPMIHLVNLLRDMKVTGRVGCDSDGYQELYGYRGPRLSHLLSDRLVDTSGNDIVEGLRMRKTDLEVRLIKESARWGDRAHRLLQTYSAPSKTESEVSSRASGDATREMLAALGPGFRDNAGLGGSGGARAGFRGQVGANSALSHAVNINAVMQPGDVLVTGASSYVLGYKSELERTMFVSSPDEEKRRLFQLMVNVQDVAFDAIRPGRLYSDVDRAVRDFFERHDLTAFWRHHVGHNLGLEIHEAPFFDVGDSRVIETGHVVSVEPGIYVTGLGGFRHSDTVLVTVDGIELMTTYPRDLQSLICT